MKNNYLDNKSILITGGTGSFGQNFVSHLLNSKNKLRKLIIFSRDEFKQYNMSKKFNEQKFPCIRYIMGDVRDKSSLQMALKDVDIVIHAAALKQVSLAEYNPFEYIKTNIIGAQNIVETSLNSKVQNVIALSTDKASSPINLYGASKLCSDKLFIAGNAIKGRRINIKFSAVRYGNVFSSRGSVVPLFIEQKKNNIFSVTHTSMTRFSITMKESVKFVLDAILKNYGGEIFIPKIPSYRILDLVHAISKKPKIKMIGLRHGEKIHEEMLSEMESVNTFEDKDKYIISSDYCMKFYKKKLKKVNLGFCYNSGSNKHFLKNKEIKSLIKKDLLTSVY